jgi:hypothetical protein
VQRYPFSAFENTKYIFIFLCCPIMCMYVLSSVLLCFRIKMMFGSSLPPAVCKRAHVLFTFFVFVLCCKLLWIVHLRLSFRYSLTFYDLLEQTFRFFIILTTVISRRKFQWYIASVTFGAQYLTGMVTSVLPYDTFSLIKKQIPIKLKTTKITSKIQISEVCDL